MQNNSTQEEQIIKTKVTLKYTHATMFYNSNNDKHRHQYSKHITNATHLLYLNKWSH